VSCDVNFQIELLAGKLVIVEKITVGKDGLWENLRASTQYIDVVASFTMGVISHSAGR
jgi:hypothetical protein